MPQDREAIQDLGAPLDRPVETLDARDLPPPEPLQRSLERLAELDDRTVLVQYNDRIPRHLFPKLDNRGYAYAAEKDGEMAVTAVWRELE